MTFLAYLNLDFILITFPLMLYLFYITYNQNTQRNKNSFIFNIALITSLYLIIKFGIKGDNNINYLIITIPLIIAYSKKDKFSIFLLSLFIICFYYMNYRFNLVFMICEYLLYYGIYVLLLKYKKNIHYFVSLFLIIKFSLLWQLIYKTKLLNESLLEAFIICLIVFGLVEFILYLLNKANEIIKYHMSYKELQKEKQIRLSLFKITHEIKNPLAVCKGYLDMLDINDEKQIKKYIPIIKSEINRTLVILQDFLCMNKSKIEKEPMDVNLLVEEVIHNIKPIMKQKNITCNLDLVDDEIYINGDYNRLMQVFINIIKNSIEAIDHENGIINIKTENNNNNFNVTVSDNGVGMKKDVMKKISEPFYTTKKNGTGLGVSLSKEILAAHNAVIDYDSKEGIGTTVMVSIPIV